MILMGKLALGFAGAAVAGVGLLCSEGLVDVNVVERQPEQHHIHIVAPALLVPATLHFVPKQKLAQGSREMQECMPMIRVALHELRKAEDMTFVEVKQEGEHVLVKKVGGSIVVDVDDADNTVHVSTPIRTIESSIEEIAAASPAAQPQ